MPISKEARELLASAKNVSNESHATVMEVLVAQLTYDLQVVAGLIRLARDEFEAEEAAAPQGCCRDGA